MTEDERRTTNVLVAEVLGWRRLATLNPEPFGPTWIDPLGHYATEGMIPNYAGDWHGAGLALDWLAGQGVPLELHHDPGLGWGAGPAFSAFCAVAGTGPEAVARALVEWHAARAQNNPADHEDADDEQLRRIEDAADAATAVNPVTGWSFTREPPPGAVVE